MALFFSLRVIQGSIYHRENVQSVFRGLSISSDVLRRPQTLQNFLYQAFDASQVGLEGRIMKGYKCFINGFLDPNIGDEIVSMNHGLLGAK